MCHILASSNQASFQEKNLQKVALKLDKYYRAGISTIDRISIALRHLSNALESQFYEQAFIDFTIALEAMVSTKSEEITHTLAERVAILLNSDADKPLDIYSNVRRVYGIRSKIVHGSVSPKKGIQTSESLYITSKGSF